VLGGGVSAAVENGLGFYETATSCEIPRLRPRVWSMAATILPPMRVTLLIGHPFTHQERAEREAGSVTGAACPMTIELRAGDTVASSQRPT